jgi:hypothetical protein
VTVRASLGDRRAFLRYQVIGDLWASIEVHDEVVLRNIAAGGALLETTLSPTVASIRAAYLTLPDHGPELMVAVRHVSPLNAPLTRNRWLLGVEFIRVTSRARESIDAFVNASLRASSPPSAT